MVFLKQLLNFYINSSIHVALSVFSLAWITIMEYQIPYDENVLYFAFYAAITGYNFVKYFGMAKFHHRRLATWLKLIQILSLICFLLMCYYGYHLDYMALICVLGFGIVTFFYAMPILPNQFLLNSSEQNLRNIEGIKVYLIALVWSGVSVFLPLINNKYAITINVLITALQRFIFVIVLMLPFEIRDLQYDSLKLATIPQKIGVTQTKIIGMMFLVLFLCLELLKNEMTRMNVLPLLILAFFTGLLLVFSKIKQGKYYSSFWVESLPILWLLLVLLFD